MQNISSIELSNYVQNVGTPAPGIDRIQFEVLRVMLYHPDFEGFCLENLVLSLANKIISSKRFPGSMKEALLTFIPKDGDPLLHTNYRGIALLSSLYKVVIGVLNYRLTQLLRDHGGMEINQGGNKKGVNAAHKAAVLINVITDARMQKKPLHIIYTDLKKAFPSTPYEAFHDALRVLGMNPDFMELIVDTQTDFVTTAKGPIATDIRLPCCQGEPCHPYMRWWQSLRIVTKNSSEVPCYNQGVVHSSIYCTCS
jgi:hypothetical protein